MFGLEYLLALIKILFNVAFAVITAIPLSIAWNSVARIYFTMLPEQWLKVPYGHIVALLLVTRFVGEMIQCLTPKIISINSSSKAEGK